MSKKITILGKGTAGSIAAAHFSHYTEDEIEVIYDSNIPEAAVGEGSQLSLPKLLTNIFNLSWLELSKINYNAKQGIMYQNWGANNYFHNFPIPESAWHFNALSLQNFIKEKIEHKVNYIDKHIKNVNELDTDYVIDCRGKPTMDNRFAIQHDMVINSAYVVQCPWNYPKIQYTLAIARPYGWVFGVPLSNRLSLGYMYNDKFNTVDEVKKDIEEVLNLLEEEADGKINNLSFNNYKLKQNYSEYQSHNGNASFFLEPLEATSIETIDFINRQTYDLIYNGHTIDYEQQKLDMWFDETNVIIMMHYAAGSQFDTPFWKHAIEKGWNCLDNAPITFTEQVQNIQRYLDKEIHSNELGIFGAGWNLRSQAENLIGLGIYDKLIERIKIAN